MTRIVPNIKSASENTDAIKISASHNIQWTVATAGTIEIAQGAILHARRKPNWFHRTMMRLMLGWKWRDA